MKIFVRSFLSLALLVSNLPLAQAAAPTGASKVLPGQQLETFLTLFTQTTFSAEQIVNLYRFTDLTEAEQSPILSDVKKNIKDGDLPKMKLVDDQFFFDGAPSGLRITSYQPLKVEYKKKTWTYEPKQSAQANYDGLMKILADKEVASFLNVLLPQAHAQERQKRAALVGAGALIVVGGILYFAAGAITIPVTVIALAAGAIGGKIGWESGKKVDIRQQQAWADALLKSRTLKVDCSEDRVAISGMTPRGQSVAIRFERIKQGQPGLLARGTNWAYAKAFGTQPSPATVENRQYIAGNFGGRNVSERDIQTPLQRNSSFTPALEFTGPQSAALAKIMSCKNMDEWVSDCFKQKLRKCTGITVGENMEFDELMRRAQEQKKCIDANAQVIGEGRCMLPLEVFRAYNERGRTAAQPANRPGAK